MARTALSVPSALSLLSVLSALVLGAGLGAGWGVDEPGVLLALVGAALWALGRGGAVRPVAVGTAVVVRGRAVGRRVPGVSRQLNPDAPGRPRPRAPGRALPAA